jgi:hypothetical protein
VCPRKKNVGKMDANKTKKTWADMAAGAEQPKERGDEESRERMEQHEAPLGPMHEPRTPEKRNEQPGNVKPDDGKMEQNHETTLETDYTTYMMDEESIQGTEIRPEEENHIERENQTMEKTTDKAARKEAPKKPAEDKTQNTADRKETVAQEREMLETQEKTQTGT